MAFTPSAAQRVLIARPIKRIGYEVQNVLDALLNYARLYQKQVPEVQAEAEKIISRARLVQIYNVALPLREEIEAAVLAYEGEDTLPVSEEDEEPS